MFLETVKTEGLAHLSYVFGAGGTAAVVDPRRDCDVYVEIARGRGTKIAHIFETHRNEDLVSGAARLSRMTGAPVHHGPNPAAPVAYADRVREGDSFRFGALRLDVLETPGHTDDSLSFALYDESFGGERAVGVFTGDALFIGDVGRTDFYPDRAAEVAGLLYDSLRKILALGDQALLYPAHGAGSVCGAGMAEREFSSLGYERMTNPMLQYDDRAAFVEAKLAEKHRQPPYFRLMEKLNLEGADLPSGRWGPGLAPQPLSPAELGARLDRADAPTVLDVRAVAAFCGAHVPGAISMPVAMVPAFAGWLLDPEREIALVADDRSQAEEAAVQLLRIGFDRLSGVLVGMEPWASSGRPFATLPMASVDRVRARVEHPPERWQILDVRGDEELESARVPVHEGAFAHVYAGEIPRRLNELERGRAYTVMCGSGVRATVAASVLQARGFENLDVFMGSMAAWKATAA
jgi:hydroxyacylglutathione hydrolase